MAMPKNMNMMMGTKPSTPPTPSMTPEMSIDLKGPSGNMVSTPLLRKAKNELSQSTRMVL